jgi:Tol biopolymer transport system component
VIFAATFVVALIVLALPASASSRATAASSSLIAFDTRYSADVSQIYTIRPDGSDRHRLTNSSRRAAWDPAFSPDGSHIAFARDGSSGSVIAVMDTDGTGRYVLRADVGYDDYAPAWTSDGLGIVFVRCPAPGYPCRIASMDLDGTHLVELTSGSGTTAPGRSAVSGELDRPSRRWMEASRSSDRGGYDTSVRDGGGRGRLSRDLQARDRAGDPSWSLDGDWISVTGDPQVGTTFLLHPDGSGLHSVDPGRSSRRSPRRASASWRCRVQRQARDLSSSVVR